MSVRESFYRRETRETRIELSLAIDGEGRSSLQLGIPFMEHMLALFARHGLFNLEVKAEGDLEVDGHHTVEDLGLCLGEALKRALGDKKGINRYGFFLLPMDDALALIALDLSGRPYLQFDVNFPAAKIGSFETDLVLEFLKAFSTAGGFNLHVKQIDGSNSHHLAEAIFKGLGRALSQACAYRQGETGIPSSKGYLE